MNLVEYQSEIESMIETKNFDQRTKLENLATQSTEHQKVWEDFLIVEHSLPAWKQSLPDVDLVESVISQLTDPRHSSPLQPNQQAVSTRLKMKPRASTRWIYASVLSLAVLLIAVFTNHSFDVSEQLPSNSMLVNQSEKPTQPTPAPQTNTNDNSLNQLLRNAKAASWGLAQSTAGTMTEAVNLVPIVSSSPDSEGSNSEQSTWVDDINKEMQPLKDQLGHAWNFIIHSVPEESNQI